MGYYKDLAQKEKKILAELDAEAKERGFNSDFEEWMHFKKNGDLENMRISKERLMKRFEEAHEKP